MKNWLLMKKNFFFLSLKKTSCTFYILKAGNEGMEEDCCLQYISTWLNYEWMNFWSGLCVCNCGLMSSLINPSEQGWGGGGEIWTYSELHNTAQPLIFMDLAVFVSGIWNGCHLSLWQFEASAAAAQEVGQNWSSEMSLWMKLQLYPLPLRCACFLRHCPQHQLKRLSCIIVAATSNCLLAKEQDNFKGEGEIFGKLAGGGRWLPPSKYLISCCIY